MDDSDAFYTTDSDYNKSTSSVFATAKFGAKLPAAYSNLGDCPKSPSTYGCQTKQQDSDTFGVQADQVKMNSVHSTDQYIEQKDCAQCVSPVEPFCHVKLNSITKLRDSTKKLLYLLEEIQGSSEPLENQLSGSLQKETPSVYHSKFDLNSKSFDKSDNQPKSFNPADCEAEVDDCSVYKRLTRKCHCLNQFEYNDFIIHFNEATKYFTSTMGEIIKNMRIVKKFIYMGGNYTKHALMFLNEGLTYSAHMEKLDIIQGCAHADVCNVFDDQSIVVTCISWPCNDAAHGDTTTQSLAASFLNKLAQIEEGRRYLKYSSKITNDLKKVVRNKSSKLDYDVLESINDTLNLMQPAITPYSNLSYYCKPTKEGFGCKTVNTLLQYRAYMTLEEVYAHLDLLNNLSNNDSGKSELATLLPTLLQLFKHMLIEYNDSEMNIIITDIMNNIVTRKMIKPRDHVKTVVMAETATEPIKMKTQINQVPDRTLNKKVKNKSVVRLSSPTRLNNGSKIKSSGWEPSLKKLVKTKGWEPSFKKFVKNKGPPDYSVITVPVSN